MFICNSTSYKIKQRFASSNPCIFFNLADISVIISQSVSRFTLICHFMQISLRLEVGTDMHMYASQFDVAWSFDIFIMKVHF